MGKIRVGLSGWSYEEWRGDFYPDDLPRGDELAYVGEHFATAEINTTFYSLRRPETFRTWAAAVPRDFVFAVKGSRYLTHNRRLADPHDGLANFLASGVLALGAQLGPILWQLPADLHFGAGLLEDFLEQLPRDTESAAALAAEHGDPVAGRAVTGVDANHRLRHAVEVRHASWFRPDTVQLLRHHNAALVISDAGDWPRREELTAGWVYVRLHGRPDTYASRYGDATLDRWARRIRAWHAGDEPTGPAPHRITDRVPPRRKERDVYVYFDNDAKGHAPRDAQRLRERLE